QLYGVGPYAKRRSYLSSVPRKTSRHHVSLEELILFRALKQDANLDAGWWLTRFFHKRTTTTKPPTELPGGPFISILIHNLKLENKWGPETPLIPIKLIGAELAIARCIDLSESLEDCPSLPHDIPPPIDRQLSRAQITAEMNERLARIEKWQLDYSAGSHQWQKDRVAHEQAQNERWSTLQQFMADQTARHTGELAWRRQIEQRLAISPVPPLPPPADR
ncbi:hypothetical protein LINPERHAP1_LOCUS15795, partial [Linum perenne]